MKKHKDDAMVFQFRFNVPNSVSMDDAIVQIDKELMQARYQILKNLGEQRRIEIRYPN